MAMARQVCDPPTSELCAMTATALAGLVREKAVSPVDVVKASMERIEQVQPVLNPFCFTYPDEAIDLARKAEEKLMRGETVGPLHGVPLAIKDFTPTKGKVTTRGSVAFKDWVPDYDPVIVRRLRDAGAIMVGKTTTPEFAHSSFTRSKLWGDTLNPWDSTRTSGGSSGGSGVSVATGCVPLAEGTDMGGSVRIPASLCGVVGCKPSLGRIPMDILPSIFDSISHFGPITRTVEDAALFLTVAEGPDDADIQSQVSPRPIALPVDCNVNGLKVALSPDLGFYDVHPDVLANLENTANALESAGAIIEEIELDWTAEVTVAWGKIWEVMLAACFADCLADHRADMDPDAVALIDAGLKQDAVSYKRLEDIRTRQWRRLATVFSRFDALLCPTMAQPAPPADRHDVDFEQCDAQGRLAGLDMTAPFNNVPQCPALTVPSGFSRDGLPTGAQIVSHRFDDPTVFRIGAAIEAAGIAGGGSVR